jgi:hypothetical protein
MVAFISMLQRLGGKKDSLFLRSLPSSVSADTTTSPLDQELILGHVEHMLFHRFISLFHAVQCNTLSLSSYVILASFPAAIGRSTFAIALNLRLHRHRHRFPSG